MTGSGSSGVRSVQLAIDVLEAVAFSTDELGVTQIADRLKMTKGSVHRHLQTLVERGYLAQNSATSRYLIGPKSRLLARHAPEADLVHLAEGPMRQLRDILDQPIVLSEMSPRGALVLANLSSTSPIEIGVHRVCPRRGAHRRHDVAERRQRAHELVPDLPVRAEHEDPHGGYVGSFSRAISSRNGVF